MKNEDIARLTVRNNDLYDRELVYYPVEFYKSDDCTGVAHVNGPITINGKLQNKVISGDADSMGYDDWGGQVRSLKLTKHN